MKLEVDPFDGNSIQKAIDQLKAYDVSRKLDTLMTRLAEEAVTIAQNAYNSTAYDGLDKSVTVRFERTSNGIKIIASGTAVAFLEFGAGVRYGYGYPDNEKPPEISAIGTYGKGHGSNPEGWYITPTLHTYGNEPAMGMLKARDAIVSQVMQIAREVFR